MSKKIFLILSIIAFICFSYVWTNWSTKYIGLLRYDARGRCPYDCIEVSSWVSKLSFNEKLFTFTYGLPGLLFTSLEDILEPIVSFNSVSLLACILILYLSPFLIVPISIMVPFTILRMVWRAYHKVF